MVMTVGSSDRGGQRTWTALGRVQVSAGQHQDRFHRRRIQGQPAIVPDRAGDGTAVDMDLIAEQDAGAAVGQGDVDVVHAGGDTVELWKRARDRRER